MRRCLAALLLLLLPAFAQAGVYISFESERIDPSMKEPVRLILTFDGALYRSHVSVHGSGGFSKEWDLRPVVAGKEYSWTWPQAEGKATYEVKVEMVTDLAEKEYQDGFFEIAAAVPITASIPPDSVDIPSRSFDVVSNHPPSSVEVEVMGDDLSILGQSTFVPSDAVRGKAVRVTWEPTREGTVFRVLATVRDEFDYYARVEIVPWALEIPHDDVIFATNQHTIPEDEAPKVDKAWAKILEVAEKYKEFVQCSLYVAGYTDTVGNDGDNQALSERRAMSLARYFQSKGAKMPIHYQGFGEGVLAVETGDNVDESANRRALYIITAGQSPKKKDTPRAAWRRAQ